MQLVNDTAPSQMIQQQLEAETLPFIRSTDVSRSICGDLSFRMLGNYILKMTSEQFGVTNRCDGSMGLDGSCGTVPKLRANLSVTYTQGRSSFTVQERFRGSTKLARNWSAKNVDDNSVSAIGYVDLRGSFEINDHVQLRHRR